MVHDFFKEYAQRSDDELLSLSSDRDSLTQEASAALDVELRRRNLTKDDQAEYQRFVHRMERREYKSRRRKLFGVRERSLPQLFWAIVPLGLILLIYFALPGRYQLKPDWEDAAACTVIATVCIVGGGRSLWRDITFWMALILSSAIQLTTVHAWVQREGSPLSRGDGKAAVLLGFLLWIVIYGIIWFLRRRFQTKQDQDHLASRSG